MRDPFDRRHYYPDQNGHYKEIDPALDVTFAALQLPFTLDSQIHEMQQGYMSHGGAGAVWSFPDSCRWDGAERWRVVEQGGVV